MSPPHSAPIWRSLLLLLVLRLPLIAQSSIMPMYCIAKSDTFAGGRNDALLDVCTAAPDLSRNLPGNEEGLKVESANPDLAEHFSRSSIPFWESGPKARSASTWLTELTNSTPGTRWFGDPLFSSAREGKTDSPANEASSSRSDIKLDRDVYYRNKLEFAFDVGWLPINIPFVFDVFLGDSYNMTPLKYTLIPMVASLRWQIDDVDGPWIFRGNWDMTVSGSITAIARGPETHYISYDMGIRRNFVPRRGKIAPYFDGRLGLGKIDAKEPLGILWAQGQNFTFTVNMGSGIRYNFNSRYSASAGLNWMHISNLYLSEPAFSNYGINVYGPMFGLDIRLGKPRPASK